MVEDYLIKVTIQNNVLLNFMHKRGFYTIISFCKNYNVSYQYVSSLLNFKAAVFQEDLKTGVFTEKFLNFCKKVNCNPMDVVSPNYKQVKENKFEKTCDNLKLDNRNREALKLSFNGEIDGNTFIPNDTVEQKECSRLLDEVMKKALTPREYEMVRLHYFDNRSIIECSKIFNRTHQAIRNTLTTAISKMQRVPYQKKLKAYNNFVRHYYSDKELESNVKVNGKYIWEYDEVMKKTGWWGEDDVPILNEIIILKKEDGTYKPAVFYEFKEPKCRWNYLSNIMENYLKVYNFSNTKSSMTEKFG